LSRNGVEYLLRMEFVKKLFYASAAIRKKEGGKGKA
jgi:hypothetical protein